MANETSNESPKFMIQIGAAPGGTVTPQMSLEDFIEGSVEHFQGIAEVIEVAGQNFVHRVKNIASKPTNCSIEFGINVGGEAGIPFVTKGTIGSNFKVTISWDNKE